MIDTHCHLNFHSFTSDYDEVIQRAKERGVTKIINVGTKIDSSRQAVELAEKYEDLYAIVGIHPHHADKVEEGWIEKLEKIAKNKKVVGIGEIGLDYFSYKSNGIVEPQIQKQVFQAQINLAFQVKLPLQIHNRQAGEDIIKILKENKHKLLPTPGMFHCFAGSEQVLGDALELGFYIGFDGNVTYDGLAPRENTDLKDIARLTPIDRMVVETDSPYLTPEPHRGTRNEPAYVILIAEFLAKIKGISFEEFDAQTTHNAETLFKLKARR
ncbi:MAG: TatD family hydrolase [Patescibacteria group bacterium]